MYGIKIGEIDGELCLRLDRERREYPHLFEPFHAWQQMTSKLDTSEIRAKVPSQKLSDELIKALKKENQ